MRMEWIVLILAIVVGLAWRSGIKLPKISSGNAVGQWFKSVTGNLGWLLAIGGQAFCLILIWQCFPEFFGHWLKTNGFWFIQLGFVVSTILLKYAKPQVVGVVALLLTLTCLLVSMVSASKEILPKPKTATVSIPKSVTERRWEYGWVKPPDVQGLVPSIRKERHEARIIYCDQFRFDIIIYLRENRTEAFFSWDKVKNPNHGEWRQPSPENHGKWYLEPERTGDRIPTGFHGWETNKKGEMIPIWLRAID